MTKSKCFKFLRLVIYFALVTWFLFLLQCQSNENLNIKIMLKENKINTSIKLNSLIEDVDSIGKSNSELFGNPK